MPTGDIFQWENIKKLAEDSSLKILIRGDGFQVEYPDGNSSPLLQNLHTVSLMVEAFNHGRKSTLRNG